MHASAVPAGAYIPLALPLSMMARVVGVLGLLFAPVGAFWIASRYSRPLAGKHYACAVTALIVWSLVWAVVSLAAFALGSLSLAFIFLALGIDVVVRAIPRLGAFKMAPSPTVAPALYLLVVPVAVFLLQQAVLEPAVEFSRNREIQQRPADCGHRAVPRHARALSAVFAVGEQGLFPRGDWH